MGKTHPDTLRTIMNMAGVYARGEKNFAKAEEIFRLALHGHEKPLGKDHEDTMRCTKNMACLFQRSTMNSKPKMTELVKDYPHLRSE